MIRRTLSLLACIGFLHQAFAQIPLDSLRGGMCGMVDPATNRQVAIPPILTRVNVVVTDAMAQAVVTQTFVNPFSAKSEVAYLFPLPDQGSVHGMRYRHLDKLYIAKILEREKAQAQYDSIKQQGGQAALLLQDRPNIFQQRIANLGAGETAFVEIRLSMSLKYADGELELAFPTRIGQRYPSGAGTPGGWNPPADRPGPAFQFNVLVQSSIDLSSIYSPSHPIEVGDVPALRARLQDREVLGAGDKVTAAYSRGVLLKAQATYPNSDYVLRMKKSKTAPEFSLASYKDSSGGYFVLNLYPDLAQLDGSRPDLELVLLVDVSGSQMGWPLEREKEISLEILSHLTSHDDLTVLSFSDAVTYAFGTSAPVPAEPANITRAENFVRGLAVMGGTQLLNAVNASLAVPTRAEKKRVYIFLTDGFITDETSILSAISKHPSHPTIFTFGAGNNLNRYFLEECAKVGNGFATPVMQGDATGPLVEAAWSRIESPQLDNLKVDFGGLAPTDVLYPVSGKLYRGLPYTVLGKYPQGGTFTVSLSGERDGKIETFSRPVGFTGDNAFAWSAPKLWARERIGRLMLEQGTTQSNRAAIVQVSLDHQVLSSYTAFLASEPQDVIPGVPNSGGVVSTTGGPVTDIAPPGLAESLDFESAVRGGLFFLDWKDGAKVLEITIYDLHGRALFTYRPSAAGLLFRWAWDGRDARGRLLSQGRYLVSVRSPLGVRSRAFDWRPAR